LLQDKGMVNTVRLALASANLDIMRKTGLLLSASSPLHGLLHFIEVWDILKNFLPSLPNVRL
jgi:hypothetical protein